MRFASQQKVTGRPSMGRPGRINGKFFESPQAACATGLPSRKSATGWRCIHKSKRPSRVDKLSRWLNPAARMTSPTSRRRATASEFHPGSRKRPAIQHRGAASRKTVCLRHQAWWAIGNCLSDPRQRWRREPPRAREQSKPAGRAQRKSSSNPTSTESGQLDDRSVRQRYVPAPWQPRKQAGKHHGANLTSD